MARLIWRKTDGTVASYPLSGTVVLGRDAAVDCTVSARGISRRHLRVEERGEQYYLADLGSTNGTLVNGKALVGEVRLAPGDTIQIGTERLEFEGEPPRQDTRSVMATEPLSRTLKREASDPGAVQVSALKLPEVLPRRVGKFQLLEKLGQGGMGAVYRAEDRESGREVAVKFIRQQIGRKESFLEYFHHREAVLAREINHPNVIRIYEHGVADDQHYISMQYVRGQSLYQVLKTRRLEPREVLAVLRQAACGLAAAHRQGVVHSDIKPANVLLESELFGFSAGDESVEGAGDSEEAGILEFDSDGAIATPLSDSASARDEGLVAEILRRVGQRDPLSQDVLADPPYFDRPSEMRFLEHYLGRMEGRRGFFILVEGDDGTGKDRLISEFLLRQGAGAAASPELPGSVLLLELDCSRIEGIPLLYTRMCTKEAQPAGTLREMVDALKRRFEERTEPAILRVLDLGKASPLVCRLVAHLAGHMESKPVMVIASVDPEEIRGNDSVKLLIQAVEPVLKELYLRPLSEYQIQRYLQSVFKHPAALEGLSQDLYRLSEGNFARMLDLLRSFCERGILRFNPSESQVEYRPNSRELELEEGKNLYEKYRSYGKLEQRVLECAAFIGSRFLFDTLVRLHGLDETSLYFLVRKLLAEGFFTEESRTWYKFSNAAFQRYMAERIPPPDRPHLHRKVSRFLQAVPVPESAELYQLRGHHLGGCREFAKAVQCYLEGAHLARSEYQVDLAREMYQEILRIYRELSSREGPRREVTAVLRDWFRRDGNWYEILGDLGAEEGEAFVKIADFGISFRVADEERGYAVGRRPALGTPRYLAPERAGGEPGGPRSDIFSLGIIAYEMMVGEPVFPGLKGSDIARAYQARPVRVPPAQLERFPADFERLMQGMLEIDPTRRWDAERVVREAARLEFDLRMEPRARRGS